MAYYDIIVKATDATKNTFRGIENGLKSVSKRADEAQQRIDKLTGGLTKVGTVAGAALALATKSAITFAAAINDAAETTEISRKSIIALGQAMQVNGGDANKATDAVIKLSESIGSAQAGAGSAANALYELGLSYRDIKDLSPQEQFNAVVAALGNVDSSTKAAKLSSELFGKTLKGVNVRGLASEYNSLIGKQNGVADATESIGQASDKLNASWVRLQGSIAQALKPAADFINKLSPEQLDGLVSGVTKLAAAIVGLTAGLKVFSWIAGGIGIVAGYFALFSKGAVQAGTTIANLGIRWGGFTKAFAAASGLFAKFGQIWTFIGNTVGKTLPFLLGGFARMIPLIGTIITVGAILNDIIKSIFEIDIIDTFIDKVKDAWSALKSLVGIKGPQFLSSEENANELARLKNRADSAKATATPTPTPKNKFIEETTRTLEEAKENFDALMAAMGQTSNLNQAALLFAKLSSEAETLGQVLQKPANLIQRDYAMSVKKAAEELRQHEIELANTAVTTQKWNNELAQTNLQIYEQSLKLSDSAHMQKVFNQEIAQTNLQLMEQRKRLANAEYQSDKFIQLLQQTALDTKQQQITLALLNAEYAKGEMPLATYVKLLGNIDATLLGTAEKFAQFRQELSNGEKAWGDNFYLADQTWKLYQDGKLTLKELELAVSQLGEEYFNWNALLKVGITQANDAVAADEKHKFMLEQLTEQFKKGAVAADVYRKAAGNLGADSEATDRMVNVYGKAVDKMRENNEFLKKSISDAATTFSKEFTEAFVNMKNPLNAFKNLFGNILNDIATRMVKQQLADPLADAMSQVFNKIMGTSGEGKGGVAQIMTDGAVKGGDGMIEAFKGAGTKIMESMGSMGEGITGMFSGMGDSLMSIFGDVFSWISSNASSLGSSLSSLLGGLGGGGGLGGLFGSIGDFFAGWFADGGTIGAGQFGIVGEAGPEIVTGPANITPMNVDSVNSASDEGSDGGLTVNFQLYAIDTQSGVQFLLQNKPAIISMVGEAYNRRGRRGPLD